LSYKIFIIEKCIIIAILRKVNEIKCLKSTKSLIYDNSDRNEPNKMFIIE
jgi:hypothetical protein